MHAISSPKSGHLPLSHAGEWRQYFIVSTGAGDPRADGPHE